MQEQDIDVTLKVIVVGNGQVGKTSLITRYAKGVMTENYKKTIGTDFFEKSITLKSGETLNLYLWDTAGQEMFAELTKAYYRGAGAVVYAFSTTDRDSFLAVENWKRKVEEQCGPNICAVLIQNKTDLIADSKMTSAEVEDLSKRIGVKLYRTCVKDNVLVSDVFEYLSGQYLAKGGAAIPSEASAMPIDAGSSDRKAAAAAAPAAANGAAGQPGEAAAPTNGAAAADPNGAASKPFTLEASTQRTGGKKACACG